MLCFLSTTEFPLPAFKEKKYMEEYVFYRFNEFVYV